ncbi:MAG: LacI family DNA-binding transcriptional regulator [Clostridiales bacterium]|nr:LacI family DNA-binding transcriptional regulator [Clostridiales bacterium]
MKKKDRKTILDVAKEAGVSISTVSRVINNNYPVSSSTKERVERVVKKLDFKPSMVARSLIARKTDAFGIIVPGITNMFFTMVVQGIERTSSINDYSVFLSDSKGDGAKERECVKNLVSREVDGIIVIDPSTENMLSGFYDEIEEFVPIVFVNGYNDGLQYNFILNDEKTGTSDALEYLISLGHKDICFIRGYKSYSYDIKENVYKSVMNAHKIPVNNDYIINVGEGNSSETVDNASSIMYGLLSSDFKPTAIFSCNDLMAVGALNACKKLQIKVPEQISIIGFDNIIISELSEPKLTTVDQNMLLLGESAAKMLLDMLKRENYEKTRIVLKTRLIKRDSCSRVKRKGYTPL